MKIRPFAVQAVATLALLGFLAAPTLASPIQGWDPNNHVWVNVSPDDVSFQIGTSPGNATGLLIPDQLSVPCPAGVSSAASNVCFVTPNDGHTYQVSAWEVDETTAANAGTCAFTIAVAAAGAPTPVLAAVTPVTCSTPGALPATVGYQATPTTGASTPTPTAVILQGGNAVVSIPTFSATTTPVSYTGTLSIKRLT